MKELEYVTLEGKNYVILKSINEYVYLVNSVNVSDFFILRRESMDNFDNLVNLRSKEEFDKASSLFVG